MTKVATLSSNRFGWLLDYSSLRGIHVVSSYLLHRGGAKIVIPSNSIELQKSHHSSSDLLDTDDSDDRSSILSLIGLLGTKIHGLRW
jgi:hypothetical protein